LKEEVGNLEKSVKNKDVEIGALGTIIEERDQLIGRQRERLRRGWNKQFGDF
jgi:hypothetical protein